MLLLNDNGSLRLRGIDKEQMQRLRPGHLCLSFVYKSHFRKLNEVIEFQKTMGRWPYK